jgi:hypothetical protein
VFHLLASRLEKPSSVSVEMLYAVGVSLASPKCLFCVGGVKGVGGGEGDSGGHLCRRRMGMQG